ncbi:uncharacterized protein LOC123663082 [Melitaea cinxia]|uniref:uncharacterized protein LOC123663082 n=1 Tax=Melitaea cinxia TaxID=113334 RepID=UPI001E274504|nr:uncharacterized protein LOC123663082 [Melitaea cinxia]
MLNSYGKTGNRATDNRYYIFSIIPTYPLFLYSVTENNLQSISETAKDDVVLKNTECDHESVIGDKEFAIDGNRIVDFGYLFTQLLDISNHNSAFGCNLSCLKMTKEIKKGFLSKFCFSCRMCNENFELNNCKDPDSSTELNINDFAKSLTLG